MKKMFMILSFVCNGYATFPPLSIKVDNLGEIANHNKLAPGTPVMCAYSPTPYIILDDSVVDNSTRFVRMSRPHTTWFGFPTTKMHVTLKKHPEKDIDISRGSITTTPFGRFAQATVTCAAMYALYQLKTFVY